MFMFLSLSLSLFASYLALAVVLRYLKPSRSHTNGSHFLCNVRRDCFCDVEPFSCCFHNGEQRWSVAAVSGRRTSGLSWFDSDLLLCTHHTGPHASLVTWPAALHPTHLKPSIKIILQCTSLVLLHTRTPLNVEWEFHTVFTHWLYNH